MQAVTIDRDKFIGGSDVPIIMSISTFKSRFDLLLEKACIKENEFLGNEYTEYGNVMEEKIRNYVNMYIESGFKEGKYVENDIRCHTDGINTDTVLEIKTTSQIHKIVDEYKVYLVQLLFYMYHTKRKNGILAVYKRPDDFSEEFDSDRLLTYKINIKDYEDLVNQINASVDQFRIDLAKVKANPFITEEELMPNDLVTISNKVILLEQEIANYKELEEKYKTEKENLKQAMIKSNVKKWITPNEIQITLVTDTEDKEVDVEYCDEEKFISENAELYETYHNKLAEYKAIKKELKKGKKGYVKITLPKE